MNEFKQIKNFEKLFNAIGEKTYNSIVFCRGLYNVELKKSLGSTNPKMVAEAIRREEKWLNLLQSLKVKGEMR